MYVRPREDEAEADSKSPALYSEVAQRGENRYAEAVCYRSCPRCDDLSVTQAGVREARRS